ncbi:MAG: mannitol dehydrogenase family protein [Rikenellaceae bacterium]
MKTNLFNYSRKSITASILHFGVGNFHRAHLQCYTNQLLESADQAQWGICGAMIMPQDEKLYHTLKGQDGVYSLTVCGRDGNNEVYQIGSLVELLWNGQDSEAIINKVADPAIKIITLTITEGGYNTDKSTGEFIFDNHAIQHDLNEPQNPSTIFGYLAEGLRRRMNTCAAPITILSCDNLQHNGDTCKRVFSSFFAKQDPQLAAWVKDNVTFPNSMVDRITPATTANDIERINKTLDQYDGAPVYCEDYIQWVVEDKFIAGRPAWERVGVEFTDDVDPYENMKLSLLNASHTLLSYPSFVSGYRKVDQAMKDENIIKFVSDFMELDVTPYVPAPKNTDLDLYKKTLIERFANSAVSDQIARLCGDGASKFPVYVMPVVAKMIKNGDSLTRIAYLIAAYRHYLKYRTDDNKEGFDIFEPWLTDTDMNLIESDNALEFLKASPFSSVALADHSPFVCLYQKMVTEIANQGAMQTLISIIS